MSWSNTTLAIHVRSFLLVRELGLSHLFTTQDDIEHALHVTQQLLVRCRSTTLEVSDDGRRAVALGREILLGHSSALVVLSLRACLGDGLSDGDTDSLGLDDVVGAVDLGQALAFCVAGLCIVSVEPKMQ
jgi:hypothetical protein